METMAEILLRSYKNFIEVENIKIRESQAKIEAWSKAIDSLESVQSYIERTEKKGQ